MLTFVCLVIFGLILLIATCMCLWQLLQQAIPGMKDSAQGVQDTFASFKQLAELILGKDFFGKKKSRPTKPKEEEEPIKDAEFRDVEPDKKPEPESSESQPANESKTSDAKPESKQAANNGSQTEAPAKIPGSYERVELHLSSGVDYIEYYYFDDNDNPMEASKATKCLIRECAADGAVMRELWGKPYKNQIYDHMRDIFKRS